MHLEFSKNYEVFKLLEIFENFQNFENFENCAFLMVLANFDLKFRLLAKNYIG